MKNAQQAISTQRFLAVTFKRIDLNPESPVSVNDLTAICPSRSPARHLHFTVPSHAIGQQALHLLFWKRNYHLIISMTSLLVSPALFLSPSNSSFPVDRVPILPSLQTLIVCAYSVRAKLRMWYPKFFHNLVPDSHSILCSGLPALSEMLPGLYTALSSLWHALPYSRSLSNIILYFKYCFL